MIKHVRDSKGTRTFLFIDGWLLNFPVPEFFLFSWGKSSKSSRRGWKKHQFRTKNVVALCLKSQRKMTSFTCCTKINIFTESYKKQNWYFSFYCGNDFEINNRIVSGEYNQTRYRGCKWFYFKERNKKLCEQWKEDLSYIPQRVSSQTIYMHLFLWVAELHGSHILNTILRIITKFCKIIE